MAEKQTTEAKTQKRQTVYRSLYIQVDAGQVYPFIPGTVIDVFVKKGAKVNIGDKLLLLHAMKMNNDICAPIAGTVKSVNVKAGHTVSKNDVLVEIE